VRRANTVCDGKQPVPYKIYRPNGTHVLVNPILHRLAQEADIRDLATVPTSG